MKPIDLWTTEDHLLEEIARCNADLRRSTARVNDLRRQVEAEVMLQPEAQDERTAVVRLL